MSNCEKVDGARTPEQEDGALGATSCRGATLRARAPRKCSLSSAANAVESLSTIGAPLGQSNVESSSHDTGFS